jgi:hypothetical protein
MNTVGNKQSCPLITRARPRGVPEGSTDGPAKAVVRDPSADANASEIQFHTGTLQADPSVHPSPPAILQPTYEFVLLHNNAQRTTLKDADAVGPILPRAEHPGSIVGDLLGGPSTAPEDGEDETSDQETQPSFPKPPKLAKTVHDITAPKPLPSTSCLE